MSNITAKRLGKREHLSLDSLHSEFGLRTFGE